MANTIICYHNGEIAVSEEVLPPDSYPYKAFVYRHIPGTYQAAYVYQIGINYLNQPIFEFVDPVKGIPPEILMTVMLLGVPNPS